MATGYVTERGETISASEWEVVEVPARRAYFAIKRLVDVLVSLIGAIPSIPVVIVLAIAIKVDSRGHIFFSQERIGKDGRVFKIYKLRSMVADAPRYSLKVPMFDPRITRVGRFLRASGLDELPQLFNVIRGDMTLIGPRPEQPTLIGVYKPWELQRLQVVPGITGWWQIHHRHDAPMHEAISYDLYYIENMGPRLDLKIAGLTLKTMFSGAWRILFRGAANNNN